jgi:hypothetical protein
VAGKNMYNDYLLGGYMLRKEDLGDLVVEALNANNGNAKIVDISKYIWDNYEEDLRESGELFYTWRYDMRWAATNLRKQGVLRDARKSPEGIWELIQ